MAPHEYPLDTIWNALSERVVAARLEAQDAEEEANVFGWTAQATEEVARKRGQLRDCEAALAGREQVISAPGWRPRS